MSSAMVVNGWSLKRKCVVRGKNNTHSTESFIWASLALAQSAMNASFFRGLYELP